ncbi:hypothetical protein N7491_006248 [Penicillium cf. griseofulvum]|uniref:Uncharacterized protein n=1 Tax=Penicillium cf. griseofulvum TaxID=2972120 RepID=A0A9W9IXC6_9EURO|nr:hypothetical protein N7472_010722 [Penicillium cf. griseofulvum]KAJ5429232.1 hypothetical protein N7491_006248 [Penicillium cf. griseofulvum]KAJ5436975.1 hypothetical protein N7445_007860 [Penicillium cf. griseofulvum]
MAQMLDLGDLALLALRFHNPGRIDGDDALQLKLDIFGDPRCTNLKHTQRVLVTGSWYDIYHEIESNLGSQSMLSPAARMLSNIIASCVIRMPNLKEFNWDLAVSPTQHLVTTVIFTPTLERVQLRLGTDSTPSPYFHPPLEFWPPINVGILTLIQIDDETVLRSIGSVLRTATRLRELTMWADGDRMLHFSEVSSTWCGQVPFKLSFLDLRGFVDLGRPSCALWSLLSPVKLRTLNLNVCPGFDLADSSEFWGISVVADLKPKQLSTNLVVHGLEGFIHSFSGLEAFSITSPAACVPEPLDLLLDALEKLHSATLKVLSIDPQGVLSKHLLDDAFLNEFANRFPNIEELRFGMVEAVPENTIPTILKSPLIRLLYVNLVQNSTEGSYVGLERYLLHLMQKGMARNLKYFMFDDGPLFKVLRKPLRVSKEILPVGFIHDTFLFRERVFEWAGSTK